VLPVAITVGFAKPYAACPLAFFSLLRGHFSLLCLANTLHFRRINDLKSTPATASSSL
jgi:hypothetical protein